MAFRGPVKQLRCDCATNYVAARNELESALTQMNQAEIERYLSQNGCEWIFSTAHVSHAGEVWERMIGVSRNILNAMIAEVAN